MTAKPRGLPTLRDRNRLKAMRQVQDVALDLFDRDGFQAVTLERIATESEVSLSSIYRHFGSKEAIVLWNPQQATIGELTDEVRAGLSPVETVRQLAEAVLASPSEEETASHQRRVRYFLEVPSVRGALAERLAELAEGVAEWIAERDDRNPNDLDIQVACSALFGAVMGALRHWHATGYAEPLGDVIDRSLMMLQDGLGT